MNNCGVPSLQISGKVNGYVIGKVIGTMNLIKINTDVDGNGQYAGNISGYVNGTVSGKIKGYASINYGRYGFVNQLVDNAIISSFSLWT